MPSNNATKQKLELSSSQLNNQSRGSVKCQTHCVTTKQFSWSHAVFFNGKFFIDWCYSKNTFTCLW